MQSKAKEEIAVSGSPTRSSPRHSSFVFPQLILRNRKRLLAVYDTLKPGVSVLNVEVKSDIFAGFSSNPTRFFCIRTSKFWSSISDCS